MTRKKQASSVVPIESNLPAAPEGRVVSSLASFMSQVPSLFRSAGGSSRNTAAVALLCETSSALLPMVLREWREKMELQKNKNNGEGKRMERKKKTEWGAAERTETGPATYLRIGLT